MTYLTDELFERELQEHECAFLERSVIWTGTTIFGRNLNDDAKSWLIRQLAKKLTDLAETLQAAISRMAEARNKRMLVDRALQRVWWQACKTASDPVSIPDSLTAPHPSISLAEYVDMLSHDCMRFTTDRMVSYWQLLGRHSATIPCSVAAKLLREHVTTVLADVHDLKWNVLLGVGYKNWFKQAGIEKAWADVVYFINLVHRDLDLDIWSGDYIVDLPGTHGAVQTDKPMRPENASELRELIRELREKRGWSQERVAEEVKVSARTVSAWEAGASIPRGCQLIELSRTFDVPVEDLSYAARRGRR